MKNILIGLFCLITSGLFAQTTYYIKDGGSDAADGLSDATAWATIYKMRATTLSPGDSVLFKRGDVWHVVESDESDALRLQSYSGAVDNYIYYGSYGTGDKPVLTGRQSIPGWDTPVNWTDLGSNRWSANILPSTYSNSAISRGRLWLNGQERMKYNSTSQVSAERPWCYNNQTLYVYAENNPATYYTNIESVGAGIAKLAILGQDYIHIENIDFRGGGNQIQISSGSNIIIENCSIGRDCGGMGILVRANYLSPYKSDNVVIRNNVFDTYDTISREYTHNSTEDGLNFFEGVTNSSAYSNTFKNWSHSAVQAQVSDPDFPQTNIKIYDNFFTAPDIDYGRAVGLNFAAATFGLNTGIEFYNNYVYDMPSTSQITGDGTKFYNNIHHNIRTSFGLHLGTYFGRVENNEIYNNVWINTASEGIMFPDNPSRIYANNKIANNIFFNCGYNASNRAIHFPYAPNYWGTGNTFENNIVYNNGANNVIYFNQVESGSGRHISITEFEKYNMNTDGLFSGHEPTTIQNNLQIDPAFVGGSPYSYALQEGSEAIGAGINVGLSTDYYGNAWNATPSIGAIEYGSSPPDPAPTGTVVTSGGSILKFNNKPIKF